MRCAARVSWFAAVPPREARAFPPAARPPVFRRARSRAVVCQLAPRPRRELPARVGSFVGRKLRVSRALGSGGRCCAVACHVSGAGAAGSMLRSPAHHGMVGLPPPPHARLSLFDSCHRKIRLIGGGPVAFLGGLVAKARRKEREGDSAGDPKLYLQEALLERKLPDLDMRQLVDLPQGLDYNEWLASHTLALFEHVNLVYGAVSEFCSAGTCPDMLGPGGRAYPWYDEKGKKSRVAAPQYIDYVMTFTQKTVSDETIFPTKYANEFPSSFESIVRKIVRLLFHVVAHVYAAHFREVALLRLHSHLHLTFAHLTALHRRFGLIEHKETEVLRDLELALRLADESPAPAPAAPPAPPTPPPPESPARAAPAPIVTQPLAGAAAAGTA